MKRITKFDRYIFHQVEDRADKFIKSVASQTFLFVCYITVHRIIPGSFQLTQFILKALRRTLSVDLCPNSIDKKEKIKTNAVVVFYRKSIFGYKIFYILK